MVTSCVKVPKSDKDYDLRVPKDMAYIFSGAYISLSCKLIEQVGKPARGCFARLPAVVNVCCSFRRCWRETAGRGLKKSQGC